MSIFYETANFSVEAHPKPFISREEGEHIRIRAKNESITDRTGLSPSQAIELIRLTMVVDEALQKGMNSQGIPVVKVNYQEMGNWAFKNNTKPFLHIHVFGRANNATHQLYTEAVYLPDRSTGFYKNFQPLNESDIQAVRTEMELLFQTDKYKDSN